MDEEVTGTSWGRPPARETALMLAIEHWSGSGTAQRAEAVVQTASTFLAFLTEEDTVASTLFVGGGVTVNVMGAITDELAWLHHTGRNGPGSMGAG